MIDGLINTRVICRYWVPQRNHSIRYHCIFPLTFLMHLLVFARVPCRRQTYLLFRTKVQYWQRRHHVLIQYNEHIDTVGKAIPGTD